LYFGKHRFAVWGKLSKHRGFTLNQAKLDEGLFNKSAQAKPHFYPKVLLKHFSLQGELFRVNSTIEKW